MKKTIMFILLGFGLLSTKGFGQNTDPGSVSAQTRLGKYTAEKTLENMVGSPYFNKDWQKGTVKFANGKVFKDMEVKYNLVDDKLVLKSETGEAMTIVDPVSEFRLPTSNGEAFFKSGFRPLGKHTERTFYQVLFDGNIKLLKRLNKSIIESQSYNSPSPVKTIDESVHYYFVKNDELIEFKPTKKAILQLLKDKSEQVNSVLSNIKGDLKEDETLKSVFVYYNSLI